MTVVEIPSGTHSAARRGERWLGGRFRLDERISLDDQVSGFRFVRLLVGGARPFFVEGHRPAPRPAGHDLPAAPGDPVPPAVVDAVQSAAKVTDPRLATIYDTDFSPECPYIVSEWTPGTHLEDLVLSGLPHPALAAAMIADAADALAVAHQAGRPHLRLTPRSLRWDAGRGLKITGLGIDAALCGATAGRTRWPPTPRPWPGCCTRCSPGTGPATRPPRCRRRPGTRAASARRARSAPGCPPCWTPSPTARCGGRPPTPRCGRRLRPGSPWRSAWCSGRPTSWKGRRTARGAVRVRPGAARRHARHARVRLRAPHHAAAPAGITWRLRPAV